MTEEREGLSGLLIILTPTLIGVVGVLLLILPLRLFQGYVPTPFLPLIVIFFWSLYGKEYLPAAATFFIGLFQDILLGGALGVWASVYLLSQYIVLSQRDYFLGREQHVVWLGFVLIATMVAFLVWLMMSMLSGSWITFWPMFWQMSVTVLCYPLMAIAFSHLHKRVIVEQ